MVIELNLKITGIQLTRLLTETASKVERNKKNRGKV